MRILRTPLVIALCGLVGILMVPASAVADWGPGGFPGEPPSGDLPDECTFEEGDMGHYIVRLYDWVEDPGAVAHDQVERYGGNLGFVYTSAIKGYSAEYLPESARVLQAEPTVDYVSVDQLIWMDESSGFIQWRSCPLAPPLGPPPEEVEPPEEPEELEEPEQPEESEQPEEEPEPLEEPSDPEPAIEASPERSPSNGGGVQPNSHAPPPTTSGLPVAKAKSPGRRCRKGRKNGAKKKSARCIRRGVHAKRVPAFADQPA